MIGVSILDPRVQINSEAVWVMKAAAIDQKMQEQPVYEDVAESRSQP